MATVICTIKPYKFTFRRDGRFELDGVLLGRIERKSRRRWIPVYADGQICRSSRTRRGAAMVLIFERDRRSCKALLEAELASMGGAR